MLGFRVAGKQSDGLVEKPIQLAETMDSDDEAPLAVGLDATDSAYASGRELQNCKIRAAEPGQHGPTPVTLITGD